MAKAKLVKRKRRLRIEGVATLFFTLAIILYLGAKFPLKSYNNSLQKQATAIEQQVVDLRGEVGKLEDVLTNLQNRDRVVSMAEKKGLETNQDQVVIMGEETDDKKE